MSTEKNYRILIGMDLRVGMVMIHGNGDHCPITELRPGKDPFHTIVWIRKQGQLRRMRVTNLNGYRIAAE